MKLLRAFFILMAALNSVKVNGQGNCHCSDLEAGGYKLGRQSPIEMNSHEASICQVESPLVFRNYNHSYDQPAILTNNGHTIAINLPDLKHASIVGGALMQEEYNAVSVHPHWGTNDSCGAEHVVDNNCCSMELHIVHIGSDCDSLQEAISRGKVAVVAILIQADPSLQTEHDGLAQISRVLHHVRDFNNSVEVYDLILSKLISNDNCQNYFNYQGSLTTAPYQEVVNWIVCNKIVPIPLAQFQQFLTLRDPFGEIILKNFRSLQAKGLRRVCRTYANRSCGGASDNQGN